MMDCKEALPLLHAYLDGDLQSDDALTLRSHLAQCAICRKRLVQLEKAEALIQAWPQSCVPDGLKERIMQSLPPEKMINPWYRWVRKHPAFTAAAVFFLVMLSSFMMTWDEGKELAIRGDDLDSIIIEGNTVIVPAGKTIDGNLTVSNGKLQVEGEVKGNLVVIDGTVAMASTAHISGKVTQIDEAFSWLWFKVNELFSQLTLTK